MTDDTEGQPLVPTHEDDHTLTNRSAYRAIDGHNNNDVFVNTPPAIMARGAWPDTPTMEKALNLSSTERVNMQREQSTSRETAEEASNLPSYTPPTRAWNPITLRKRFAIALITTMLVAAAGLEIALHFSHVKTGWRVRGTVAATTGIYHYIYTLPPVAVAMVFVAVWAWTDVDIKRMQPYIDLAYGNAPASTTLLLDYSTKHPALVSYFAIQRNHWIVALSSGMVLVGLAIQPLAASLFTVKDIWWDGPNLTIPQLEQPTQVSNFNLSTFSTAAGFVQANVLYNATIPNFVGPTWSVARLVVPKNVVSNGTMNVKTVAYKNQGNCKRADSISFTPGDVITLSPLTASSSTCQFSISIPSQPNLQYGVNTVNCSEDASLSPSAQNVALWVYNNPGNAFSAQSLGSGIVEVVFCRPTVVLMDVMAAVAFQNGQLLSATAIGVNLTFGNVSDPNGPAKGKPLNGVAFNELGSDGFTSQRVNGITVGLSNAIVQNATLSNGGLDARMKDGGLVNMMEVSYSLYLALVGKQLYFKPSQNTLDATSKTFLPRLFMVDVTAHILTGVLIFFAFLGAFIHYSHAHLRSRVILPLQPGTLASAAAFTARSNVGQLLDGNLDERKLHELLRDKRFRMDKDTGRVVWDPNTEGEKRGQIVGRRFSVWAGGRRPYGDN